MAAAFLLAGILYASISVALAATIDGYWEGDPNYPWYGKFSGSHFVSYADLSTAYQEQNKIFVDIVVIVGKGERSGALQDVKTLEMTIEDEHRVRSLGGTIFDPDSDFNIKDPLHYDRDLFWKIDEAIGIQR